MKKSGLIFGLLAGVAVLSTACTSTESTQAPETAQQVAPSDTEHSAQAATVDPTQQGAAAESDPSLQQAQPQASDDPSVVEQPAAQ